MDGRKFLIVVCTGLALHRGRKEVVRPGGRIIDYTRSVRHPPERSLGELFGPPRSPLGLREPAARVLSSQLTKALLGNSHFVSLVFGILLPT